MDGTPSLTTCAASIAGCFAAVGVSWLLEWLDRPTVVTKKKGVPLGLYNQGNTCFINTLIESFAASPRITSWIDDAQQGVKTPFLTELNRLCRVVNTVESGDYSIESTNGIIHELEQRNWVLRSFEEQDCYELLSVFITTIDEELQNISAENVSNDCCSIYEILQSSDALGSEGMYVERFNSMRAPELDSSAQAPYMGSTSAQMECSSCRHCYIRNERFSALQLTIPDTLLSNGTTVQECLNKYFAGELCDLSCDRCTAHGRGGQYRKFRRKQFISKLPDCLVLHIGRLRWHSTGQPYKDTRAVSYPVLLNMAKYTMAHNLSTRKKAHMTTQSVLSSPADVKSEQSGNNPSDSKVELVKSADSDPVLKTRNKSIKESIPDFFSEQLKWAYQLQAVVVHEGSSIQGGHFYTYRKGVRGSETQKSWFRISDSLVVRVHSQEVLSAISSAYLLFYDRLKPSNPD